MSKKSKLMTELERSIQRLLAEVMKKHADPKEDFSLTEKMKIVDRAIKLEALNAKLQSTEFGKGFFDDDDENEG